LWYAKRYEKSVEVLKSLWLGDKINHTPDMLSWGEQQRVSIARALVCNASLILADEPTGALDSKTGKDLLDLFTTINAQWVTIIMVTHDKQVAAHAKKIIHLKDGLIDKKQK
jgi:putative ABC transport system ATP-binding protein